MNSNFAAAYGATLASSLPIRTIRITPPWAHKPGSDAYIEALIRHARRKTPEQIVAEIFVRVDERMKAAKDA